MNVLITGVTGLIGSALASELQRRGDKVIGVSRSPSAGQISWKGVTPTFLNEVDAVVNLAGESIAGRWTKSKKRRILDSRVEATSFLATAIGGADNPPNCLVQASAAGFYGDRGSEILDEFAEPGEGFLSEVCRQWEAAAKPVADMGIRTAVPRFAVVLANGPGALGRLALITRLGIGGPLGGGRQWWSWISLDDTVKSILHLLDHDVSGVANISTTNPETQRTFASTLGKVLRRPSFMPAPGFAITAALGEMGKNLLLDSFRLQPNVLLETGFVFEDPELEGALRRILNR